MFLPLRPTCSNKLLHQPVTCKHITILGIQFAYISSYYVGQTSGKLSGCQEQTLFKMYMYAYNFNMLVSRSIGGPETHKGQQHT